MIELSNTFSEDVKPIEDNNVKNSGETTQNTNQISNENLTEKSNNDNFEKERTCLNRWFSKMDKGSMRGGMISMVAFTIGAGCFTFPYIISLVGFIPGLILLLFTSVSCMFNLYLVLQSGLKSKIYNYNILTKECIGKSWLRIYDISNIVILSGVIMSYLTTSYQMIIEFIKKIMGYNIEPYKYILYAICCIFVNIPLCLIKEISKLRAPSIIATFSIAFVVLTVAIETPFYIKQNISDNKKIDWIKKPSLTIIFSYFNVLANYMFGYSNHNTLLLVVNDLKHPDYKRGSMIVQRSNWIVFILYCLVGLGGYVSSLDKTPEIYISRENLRSFPNDYFNTITKVVIAICLLSLTPLKWNILRESVKTLFGYTIIPSYLDILITIIGMIIFNILVYFTNIITIIDFIGGIFTVMVSFFVPTFNYFHIFPEERKSSKKIFAYIILGIFTIVGFIASIQSIISFIKINIK